MPKIAIAAYLGAAVVLLLVVILVGCAPVTVRRLVPRLVAWGLAVFLLGIAAFALVSSL